MYIKVRVLTKQKKEYVKPVADDRFEVSVREPAERNLANDRVRELMARYHAVSEGNVRIVSGHHSPSKILAIMRGDL